MDMHNTTTLRQPVSRVEVTNAFLRSVYNWMAVGLGVTAIISVALTYYPPLYAYMQQLLFYTTYGKPLVYGCMFAELGLVFFLSMRINKLSGSTATGVFLLYSALNGFTLSVVLMAFQVGSVASAFLTAMGMFAAMSVYGLYTKRDLTSLGGFLFMGLIGLVIAMLVNIFLGSSMMNFIISVIGVVIFLGLTAYDTQTLKAMGESMPQNDATAVRRGTIMGALKLYLDFINIFLFLLQMMGDRR